MAVTQRATRATLAFRPTQVLDTPVTWNKRPSTNIRTPASSSTRAYTNKSMTKTSSRPSGTRSLATSASLSAAQVAEYYELRGLFDALPFISKGPRIQPEEEFKFPTGTLFKIPSPDVGLNMASAYARALKQHGVAAIDLGFDDPDSQFMHNLIESMGGRKRGNTLGSGSNSLGEMDWHSKTSHEQQAMRYIGVHVLSPDRHGGGVLRLLRSEDLRQCLSPETLDILLTHDFDLKLPSRFLRGQRTLRDKLLHRDSATDQIYVRFRKDMLQSPPSRDLHACKAVEELFALLDRPEGKSKTMPVFVFKENMVLLVDNARFLHSWTSIKDPNFKVTQICSRDAAIS